MTKQALEDYYTYCLSTCSEARLKKVKRVLQLARKVIRKDLTKLKVPDVVKYLAYINQSDYRPYTKNDHKKIFKRFLKWYYKDIDMIEGDKVREGFKGVSKKRAFNYEKINENTLLKPKDFEKLIRAAGNLKWKALISLMYEGALRPCEIQKLKWGNLKFSESENLCRVSFISPKTKDYRKFPVQDCIVHLKRWREEFQFPDRTEKDYVFPGQKDREKPLGNGVITQMFKRICKKAGVENIFPYLLRHTRITELKKMGLSSDIVSKFAGHGIEIDELYTHLSSEDIENTLLKSVYVTEELSEEEKDEIKELKSAVRELQDHIIKGEGVKIKTLCKKPLE